MMFLGGPPISSNEHSRSRQLEELSSTKSDAGDEDEETARVRMQEGDAALAEAHRQRVEMFRLLHLDVRVDVYEDPARYMLQVRPSSSSLPQPSHLPQATRLSPS
jgi:hypothetical protein